MSWNAYYDVPHHTEVVDVRDLTYNNSRIMTYLGVHPKDDLNGKTGEELRPLLVQALIKIRTHEAALKPLEPDNKWGGIRDTRDFLKKLLKICKDQPTGKLVVH